MRRLPNIISSFRIALSLLLLLLTAKPVLFVIVYLFCGISDFADGTIARRFHVETRLGAKLDSLADLIFYWVYFFVLLFCLNIKIDEYILAGVILAALIRVANFIITRRKFNQWSMMHTIGNKLTGLMLFLLLPVCIFSGVLPYATAIFLCAVAILSALEEGLILFISKTYDANRKSLFHLQ